MDYRLKELQDWMRSHRTTSDPHPGYATDTDLTNHTAAADPHTGYAQKAGATFTGQVNLNGNLRVGASGTTYTQRRIITVNYDAASVAADASAVWNIPLPAGTIPDATKTEAIYIRGLGGAICLVASDVTVADQIALTVRNTSTAAVDRPATDFLFEIVTIP